MDIETTIKKVENGYVMRLVDASRTLDEMYVFGNKDLKEIFKKLDKFFLECGGAGIEKGERELT